MTIEFDIRSLAALRHQCVGCTDTEGCCCASFEVCVTSKEMLRILNYLPYAARYCSHLRRADGFDNVFERMGANLYSIDTDDEGLCLFAWRDASGIRCALHSVALDLDIPLADVKPLSCLLWPLSISSGSDAVVSVLDDAYSFSCNTRRRRRDPPLCPKVLNLIEDALGTGAKKHATQAAEKRRPRAIRPEFGGLGS